jgi:hypothetical protein
VNDVRYIPELSESIYSLFVYVQSPKHGIQSSFESGLHISFLDFTTLAILGDHDIYLNASPGNDFIKCTDFINIADTISSSTAPIDNKTTCRHITISSDSTVSENVSKRG